MKWPWGTQITQIQAEETAKLLLNLCQATIIGTVGVIFISGLAKENRILLLILDVIIAVILFIGAMKLLKEVNKK